MIKLRHKKNYYLLLVLAVLSLISLAVSISFGSVSIHEQIIIKALWHTQHSLPGEIITQLRLPRSLNAFITGGLLALAGVLMQTLLRNPLADPYVLGISGGSAVASLLALLLGITSLSLHVMTLTGGLVAMFIVLGLNHHRNHWNSNHLLLTGIIFASGCTAAITLILTLSPDTVLRSMMFWLIGEFYTAPLSRLGAVTLITSLLIAFSLARQLDLLGHGELKAQTLGINTRQLLLILYLLGAILTATAVSIAGPIGFIGLIVPHLLRLSGLTQHRFLLVGSVLLGGSLLCLADTIARTIIAPQQLPVGAITALIGVPVFLLLLKNKTHATY